jgi:hypothetical protein
MLVLGLFLCLSAAAAGASSPTAAPPAGLPGPPPGAGSGLPALPAPGSIPPAQPLGPAATLPAHVPGPGLLSGVARLRGLRFSLAIACRTNGRVTVAASALARGVIARAGYLCRGRRAVAQLALSRSSARRLAAAGSTLAGVRFGRGRAADQFSLTLESRSTAATYWSDGGLECGLLGADEPYVVAPDFTVSPPVIIDVRPWVAWYTPAEGWRWLGTEGVNASRWYRWTATPSGVQQWQTPAHAINPWTWAPIHVRPGKHTYAISVFEVMYWYKHPSYVWKYGPSVTSATGVSAYCRYP